MLIYFKCFAAIMLGLLIQTLLAYRQHQNKQSFKEWLISKTPTHIINVACGLSWLLWMPDIINAINIHTVQLSWVTIEGVYMTNSLQIATCLVFGIMSSYVVLSVSSMVREKIKSKAASDKP